MKKAPFLKPLIYPLLTVSVLATMAFGASSETPQESIVKVTDQLSDSLGIRSGRGVMRFPNLFFSALRVIRPREYGMIVLVLNAFAFMATGNASGINSLSFERAVEPHAFSLLSSCSFEAIPQESLTSFGVVTRRQKMSSLFNVNSLSVKKMSQGVVPEHIILVPLGIFIKTKRI